MNAGNYKNDLSADSIKAGTFVERVALINHTAGCAGIGGRRRQEAAAAVAAPPVWKPLARVPLRQFRTI